MDSKSECIKEKEHGLPLGKHSLACSKETEVKQKLESIARENGHKEGAKFTYNEQEIQIIDKRLSKFSETLREKNKRSAKETDKRIRTAFTESDDQPCCSKYLDMRSNLRDAKEAEDLFTTLPYIQVLSPYISPPAPPPPDLLDDLNLGIPQQQHIYYTPPEYENNNEFHHFLVPSPYLPPLAPPPQDHLDDLNPNSQQQQHMYYTPSDIENDVFNEYLPPNPILPQHENPAPPPPDYLE